MQVDDVGNSAKGTSCAPMINEMNERGRCQQDCDNTRLRFLGGRNQEQPEHEGEASTKERHHTASAKRTCPTALDRSKW